MSDPRAVELKRLSGELAKRKVVWKIRIPEADRAGGYQVCPLIAKTVKPICANLDFYSGFIYEMIGLPQEIYTPIFAMAMYRGLDCSPY